MYMSLPYLHRSVLAFVAAACTCGSMKGQDTSYYNYHPACGFLSNDTLSVSALTPEGIRGAHIVTEARVALKKVSFRSGENRSYWGYSLPTTDGDTLTVRLRYVDSPTGDPDRSKVGRVTVSLGDDVVAEKNCEEFEPMPRRYNSLGIMLKDGRMLSISGGGKQPRELMETILPRRIEVEDSVKLWSIGEAEVSLFVAGVSGVPLDAPMSGYTLETLMERLKGSKDPAEGLWRYFDRENDATYARPGGEYTLATVATDKRGEYEIILVDGAKVYSDRWRQMMVKGKLRATIFAGHYDLEWVDASFERMTKDVHATIEDGALLTVVFPLYKAKMRFVKVGEL